MLDFQIGNLHFLNIPFNNSFMLADRELTKGFSLNERLLGAKTPSKEGFVSFELVEEESEKGDVLPTIDKVLIN
jgi:hypothetical protein